MNAWCEIMGHKWLSIMWGGLGPKGATRTVWECQHCNEQVMNENHYTDLSWTEK